MANPEEMLTGQVSGRYLVSHEIGKGGTAVVYEALDEQTGTKVAIKILRADLAPSILAKRFLSEVRLTSQLTHPNIIRVLDSGEHGERPYVVFPLMSGGTLRRKLKLTPQAQLPVDEAVSLACTVALALGHAHREGYIHRDVKPENILLEDDTPFLADFGIARAMERALRETTTSTDIVRGTVPYMSPEQATAEKELDGRTDIYSLGCVLYEMLGGEPPFTGPTTQAVIARHLHEPPRSLRVVRPRIPAALQLVIERALAKNAADRYQTADEFAEALRNPPPVPVDPIARARRRRAWLVGGVAGIAAASAAFAMITKWRAAPAPDPTRVAVLYFDAASADSDLVSIARGITRDVIASLPTSDLTVISAPGVERFKSTESPAVVSRELDGAGTLVYGNVESIGKDSMRVSVRLVDAAANAIGSFFVEAPRATPLAMRDDVVQKVAEQLRIRLGKTVALKEWKAGTTSVAAWELRQRAQEASDRAREMWTSGAVPQAISAYLAADSLLSRASREDPRWAVPVVARGWSMQSRAMVSAVPSRAKLLDSALAVAETAVRQWPDDTHGLELRGLLRYLKWQFVLGRRGNELRDSAESDLRRATIANPGLARAWSVYSATLQDRGDNAAAVDAARRAIAADPYLREVAPSFNRLIFSHLYAEKFDSARALCADARRRLPHEPTVQTCESSVLGWSGRGSADISRAWSAVASDEQSAIVPLVGGIWPPTRFLYAAVLARSGHGDSARAMIGDTRDRITASGAVGGWEQDEAHVWTLLGEADTAFALLEKAVRESPPRRERISRHPWFKSLRSDPRFTRLFGAR